MPQDEHHTFQDATAACTAFQALLALPADERLSIFCWFCQECGRHLGPETGGNCPDCHPQRSKTRDQAAKGENPTYTTPPKAGERCPRCHSRFRTRRCALCNPNGK